MPRAPPLRTARSGRFVRLAGAFGRRPFAFQGGLVMPVRRRARWRTFRSFCRRAADSCRRALGALWRRLRPEGVPVEVLLTDRASRRALAREVRRGLRRLRRVLGPSFPAGMVVVVQQVVRADRPLAGCYEVGRRPDGRRWVLVRLALSVAGRKLGTDEVLGVLADQCFVLAGEQDGPRELVPFELRPPEPREPTRPAALEADPLVVHRNGRAGSTPRAA